MNGGLKAILLFLLNKRYIGNKHFPENKLVSSRTKYLCQEEQKQFENEYKDLLNCLFLLRLKKRTGKGDDWHISLNPRKLKEIYEMLEGEL